MSYAVKEIFHTLQGEGANAGRSAVFCRFTGCNLWSGREEDRTKAICQFCDTDFLGTDGVGGGKFLTADDLAHAVESAWPKGVEAEGQALVVCTGGEPLLQLDATLVAAFRRVGFEVAVETNGTIPLAFEVDWLCVSPKANSELVIQCGDELKLVYPQTNVDPKQFVHLAFSDFYIQPMDGPHRDRNTQLAVRYCLEHPKWKLSLQTHKYLGIP
jgi:7-carboxy-7-deazaguanine synthase